MLTLDASVSFDLAYVYSICNINRWFRRLPPPNVPQTTGPDLCCPPTPSHITSILQQLHWLLIQFRIQSMTLFTSSHFPQSPPSPTLPSWHQSVGMFWNSWRPAWPLVHPDGSALIPNSDWTFPNVPTRADYFTIAFKCFSVCFLFSVCNSVIDFPPLHSLLESWQTYSIANRMLEFVNAVLVQRCAVCWFSAPPIPRCP